MARSSCSYGSVGKSRPVSARTTSLYSATSALRSSTVRSVSLASAPQRVLARLERLVEPLRLHVHDDPAEHADEPAVRVPAEALVARQGDEALERLLVEAEVEDRVHHPGHRELGARADRDEQRVGRVAEALAGPLLDLLDRRQGVVPEARRQLLAVGEVVVARLGRDRESGRGRQAGERHLGEARALAAEQVLHRAVAFGGARAPGVDVALRGGVRTIGGCSGLGHRGGLLGWQAGTLVQRPADASRGLGRIVRRALRAARLRDGCDGSRALAGAAPGRPARPASRATLGRVRRRARSTGSAGRPRPRTTPTGAPTRDPLRRRRARHRARGRGVQRHPRQARRPHRRPGLLLGQVRRRGDAVRERAVHDDGRPHGREDAPAPVLGRVAAVGREQRGLRAVRAARADPALHPGAVAPADRPPDADDRAEGQVHARARRRPDAPVHLDRHRHRPVHLDGPRDDAPRRAAPDRADQRLLVRGRAGLRARARGLAGRSRLPADLRADDLARRRPAQRRLGRQGRPGGAGRRGRVPRAGPRPGADGRLHLRQPRDDPQRRAAPHGPRLPGVPREEGALLAQGQVADRGDGPPRTRSRRPG